MVKGLVKRQHIWQVRIGLGGDVIRESSRVRFLLESFVNSRFFFSFRTSLLRLIGQESQFLENKQQTSRLVKNNHQSIQLFSASHKNPRSRSRVVSSEDFLGEQGYIALISGLLVSIILPDLLSFSYRHIAIISFSLFTNSYPSSFDSNKASIASISC